ncbi:MAG: hypothetical protein ACO2ZP_11745, partial [Bacteriovoracaceae bacterium]
LNAVYQDEGDKINFLIKNENNENAFTLSYNKTSIDQSKIINLQNNQNLVIGIRPQKINFDSTDVNHNANISLTSNHWLGDQIHLGFELNGINIIGVADRNFSVSNSMKINFASSSINAFDSSSQKVIFNGF